MGYEERNRQLVTAEAQQLIAAHNERLQGEMLPYDAHASGCPACGTVERRVAFCPGYLVTLPPEVEQPCKLKGHHLHVTCAACGYRWRTSCKTDTEAAIH